MRIGLVLDRFDPRLGGVEQWTWQFAGGLLEAGHEVHVVAGKFGPAQLNMGIVPHRMETCRSRLQRAQEAEKVLRTLRLDVIHDMGLGWYCDVFQPHGGSRMAAFEQNLLLSPAWMRPWKRYITRLLPRYRDFQTLLDRQYAPDGRLVLALSQMVQRHMKQHHRIRPDQIRLVYNGVDTDRFSPRHRRRYRSQVRRGLGLKDEVLFLLVAHNFRLKGVPTMLRSIARMAAAGHDVHLAVVGGKRLRPWQRMVGRLKADDRVTFVGPVVDPVPYYAASDVYVHPTFYDPCSLVLLEALASGLPVVTSRFNGAAELMTAGRHGFILDDPSDSVVLTAMLEQLLDERTRKLMGGAARHLALQHTFQQNVNEVLAVYEEIAADRERMRDRICEARPAQRAAA